jgi:hypothetical protein
MAYLTNPQVTVNGVDLTGFISSAEMIYEKDSLTADTFGTVAHQFLAGLQNNSVTLNVFQSYGAGEVYATLKGLVGVSTTVKVKPNGSGAISPTNPVQELVGCTLFSLPVASGAVGELSQFSVSFQGGVWSEDVTP